MPDSVRARGRAAATWLRAHTVELALAATVFVVVYANDWGVFTPDTKPEIYLQPAQTAARFASAWLDTPTLGIANYNVGVAPVAAVFALPDALGVPAWVAMRFVRASLLVLAGWGALRLWRRLWLAETPGAGAQPSGAKSSAAAPRDSSQPPTDGVLRAGSLAAGIAYAANPYVIVGGGTLPTLLPYALLPWLLLAWLRAVHGRGWRWPMVAALVLAGMSGLNAGVVALIQLVVVVPFTAYVVVMERARVRRLVAVYAQTAGVYLLLSAYWLVPALTALGSGIAIAESTESTDGINMANSYAEVIRGLGMWTLYGGDGHGPFDPGRRTYLTAPIILVATFVGPVLAAIGVALSRARGRVLAAASVLVASLLMVGTFPTGRPSAWGRGLGAAFESVPGLIAFRTTNKVGAVLEIGVALLIGYAVAEVWLRLPARRWRVTAALAGMAAAAMGVAPALAGQLFWVRMDIPDYWREAAGVVNTRHEDTRALMVPGVGVPAYTWGYSGPDELGPSLIDRPFGHFSPALSGGPYIANLLGGVDGRLTQGNLPPGTLSAAARYLGVGDVIGRHDGRDVSSPGRTEAELATDPGLGPAGSFGPSVSDPPWPATAVTVRAVEGAVGGPQVRAGGGSLLIDGGGGALPQLQAAGLLKGAPGLRLAGTLDDDQLADALEQGARIVLTDSNARRTWSPQTSGRTGPLLSAGVEAAPTRAILTARDQVTAVLEGNASVRTHGPGLLFGPYPYGGVAQAFDGDQSTAWLFGNFGTSVGNGLVLTPRAPTPMPTVTLVPKQSRTNYLTAVRLTATTASSQVVRDVLLPPWSAFPVTTHLTDEPVTSLSIDVNGAFGSGLATTGFTQIDIPGITVTSTPTLPTRTVERLTAAAAAGGRLADSPLDVLLHRDVGDTGSASVSEAALVRTFTLPDDRTFALSGQVRVRTGASDAELNAFAGLSDVVRAEASSRQQADPRFRAAQALDGTDEADLSTGWSPAEPVVGEWLAATFPEQTLSSFTVTQPDGPDYASQALVSVDDGTPFPVTLGPGVSTVTLPAPAAISRVRLLLTERVGLGPVTISDLGLPRIVADDSDPQACSALATLDQTPILARLGAARTDLLEGRSVPFVSCTPPQTLVAGVHRVDAVALFAVDDLRLRDVLTPPPAATRVPPVAVLDRSTTAARVRLDGPCTACMISVGQSYDPRWQASIDGRDLGPPLVLDGYAAGWIVDAEGPTVVDMRYGPQRVGIAAWVVSLLALGAATAYLIWPWALRRRLPQPDSGAPS